MNTISISTIIIFSLFLSIFHASPLPPPAFLAFNCTSIPHQNLPNNSIKPLLEHLIIESQNTHFATLKTHHFTALMQCRLDLNQHNCSFCIKHAINTILRLCPSSQFLAAWFDGCYLEYYSSQNYHHQTMSFTNVSNHSCSSKIVPTHENDHFAPALETLLLTLKAEAASIETHHGLSYGELSYGKNGRKIYGIVECLRTLSHEVCDLCLGQGMGRVQEQCGGRMGGVVVVQGRCLVRFESSEFFFDIHGHGDGSMSSTIIVKDWENGEDANSNVGSVKRVLLVILGIGVAFVAIVGVCGCLVRRSIVNRARVVTDSGVELEGDKM